MNTTIRENIINLAKKARDASYKVSDFSTAEKNKCLLEIVNSLDFNRKKILEANKIDVDNAYQNNLDSALIDRLKISNKTIDAMIDGIKQIILLPDPIGEIKDLVYRPSGIQVGKMRVPLGVIGVVYESRPNVTIDVACLSLKSGNACILKGGSEAINSNRVLVKLIRNVISNNNIPESVVSFIDSINREAVSVLLQLPQYIDVIIPRGGKNLVKKISEDSRIPMIKHLEGICHIFVDEDADMEMACKIIINAKTSRFGTCNTLESLLIHNKIASKILLPLYRKLIEKNVEIRASTEVRKNLKDYDLKEANEEDWHTEYLAPILSIKTVANLEEAIKHINYYGSHHTDSIITNNYKNASDFLRKVDSASVMVNASTRFADGYEYGLGAEIGISTDKIHVRGPVGLEGLTSQKWIILGNGETRI